jgi:hypothetical protein
MSSFSIPCIGSSLGIYQVMGHMYEVSSLLPLYKMMKTR